MKARIEVGQESALPQLILSSGIVVLRLGWACTKQALPYFQATLRSISKLERLTNHTVDIWNVLKTKTTFNLEEFEKAQIPKTRKLGASDDSSKGLSCKGRSQRPNMWKNI